VQVNYFGLLNVVRAALPCLRVSPSGAPDGLRGHLINVSSAAGVCAIPFGDAYCRWALISGCVEEEEG